MAIELISTVITKNNGNYAIALSNEIKGGLHSVNTIIERDRISSERLIEGMLCYVGGTVKEYYKYDNGEWVDFITKSEPTEPIEKVLYRTSTYEEMISIDTSAIRFGSICHVELDVNLKYMYYYSIDGWTAFKQDIKSKDIHVEDNNNHYENSNVENIFDEIGSKLVSMDNKTSDIDAKINTIDGKINTIDESLLGINNEIESVNDKINNIKVGTDEDIVVSGMSIGGYNENHIIKNGTDLTSFIKGLVQKEINPIYTKPTLNCNISNNLIEFRKSTSININVIFNFNDCGDISKIELFKDNNLIYTDSTVKIHNNSYTTIINDNTTLEDNISNKYEIRVTYTEGEIKNTNMGNPYSEGHIIGGYISNNVYVKGRALSYYGINNNLNSILKDTKNYTYNNINIVKDKIIYKYPKTLGLLTSIKDANNFEYIDSYELTYDDIYNIYTLKDSVTVNGFKQIFN